MTTIIPEISDHPKFALIDRDRMNRVLNLAHINFTSPFGNEQWAVCLQTHSSIWINLGYMFII